jgi:carboxyl-terminal processing protease
MIAIALLMQVVQPQSASEPWRLVAVPAAAYAVDRSGDLTDPAGVTATIRSVATPATNGVFMRTFDAAPLRMNRVRVRGEIKTTDIGTAGVWLRVDGDSARRIGFVAMEAPLRGTADWTPFDLDFLIARHARQVVVAVAATGPGTVAVRNYRMETTPLPVASTPLGAEAQVELDSAFAIVRRHSVWRDTITWSDVEGQLRPLAAGAQTATDVDAVLRLLLVRLGDNHSTFMPPRQATSFSSTGSQNPLPDVKGLGAGIGYIRVPAFSGGDPVAMRAYADTVHARLAALAPSTTCGWVVDLRTNGGGNMYPMINGLRPLLGDQTLGFFVSGPSRSPWASRVTLPMQLANTLAPMDSVAVAVLYGPRTASSGEIVAISFRGRAKTRSFGQPTGGFSTANAMFPLPSRANLNLTTAIDADRNGVLYGGRIQPDVLIPATTPDDSTTLSAATEWLRSSCGR